MIKKIIGIMVATSFCFITSIVGKTRNDKRSNYLFISTLCLLVA